MAYIYGLCTMFYGMMAWMFWRKADRHSRLLSVLMFTICIQCIKDLFFLDGDYGSGNFGWMLMTATDMVAIPMYAFILMELVCPGKLTWRMMAVHELPFVALPVLLFATHLELFYYVLVALAGIYGTYYLVWTALKIPHYNRLLKERFSYTENINLNWLRVILYSFYLILALWLFDCMEMHLSMECLYMAGSLAMWMVIDYFIYRHESVLDELSDQPTNGEVYDPASEPNGLGQQIKALFTEQKIFLDSHLKVSDIARAVGSNRTYVSNYFNREAGMPFYDYVNGLRISYACNLLVGTEDGLKLIAEKSGFNSPQAFIRVFSKFKGMSPTEFRLSIKSGGGVNDCTIDIYVIY